MDAINYRDMLLTFQWHHMACGNPERRNPSYLPRIEIQNLKYIIHIPEMIFESQSGIKDKEKKRNMNHKIRSR